MTRVFRTASASTRRNTACPHRQKPRLHSWVYVRQYCAKIDEAARNRMELIVPELAKRNGVTEKLKADTKWNGYGR